MTTMHAYRGYVFTVTYQARDPSYTVAYPDLPDLITSGGTLAEAFAHAWEALDLHLESLHKLGLPVPPVRHRLVLQEVG